MSKSKWIRDGEEMLPVRKAKPKKPKAEPKVVEPELEPACVYCKQPFGDQDAVVQDSETWHSHCITISAQDAEGDDIDQPGPEL